MLKNVSNKKRAQMAGARIAMVASNYHASFVNGMLRAAKSALREGGVKPKDLCVIRVPGAFETPVVIAKLAARKSENRFDAIIALGVILKGETAHADHIGSAISSAFAAISVAHHIPIIHEVLVLTKPDQAQKRCISKDHNRGIEAANTALEMIEIMRCIS